MTVDSGAIRKANRRTLRRLALVALAMFGFGFALAPFYEELCQAVGIGGKVGRGEPSASARVDTDRRVTVEFTGDSMAGLPWEFRPLTKKLGVHPGETTEVRYYVRNLSVEEVTGQAIPSVTPGVAAAHIGKVECFCFTRQRLAPGEAREMPVRFVLDPGLPREVHTVTLSYAFFNTDKAQARRFHEGAPAPTAGHGDHAAQVPAAPGS
jgi:cytochrome c oxidase assembly protein subunit 11